MDNLTTEWLSKFSCYKRRNEGIKLQTFMHFLKRNKKTTWCKLKSETATLIFTLHSLTHKVLSKDSCWAAAQVSLLSLFVNEGYKDPSRSPRS